MRDRRLARDAGAGGVFLELEGAPGSRQVDFGNFRAAVGGEGPGLKALAATPPRSNDRRRVVMRPRRSERPRAQGDVARQRRSLGPRQSPGKPPIRSMSGIAG